MASGASFHSFKRRDQRVVLLQLQNTGLPIRSQHPGYRILGFFSTRKDARDWTKRFIEPVFSPDETGALWVFDAHAPVMIGQTTERVFDDEYRRTKLLELCELREDWNHKRKAEFAERQTLKNLPPKEREAREQQLAKTYSNPYRNVGNSTAVGRKTTRAKALAKEHERRRATERAAVEEGEIPDASAGIDGPWPKHLEVPGQNLAAICVLDDVTRATRKHQQSAEPIVWFWQAFEDETAASEWVQECGQKHYADPPMDVIELYKWHYPTLIDLTRVREVYPDEQLQTFMSQHKKQREEMAAFEQWQRQQGMSTRGITPAEYQRQLEANTAVETTTADDGLLPPSRPVGKGPASLPQPGDDAGVEMFDPRTLRRVMAEDAERAKAE